MAARGAHVIVVSRRQAPLQETIRQIESAGGHGDTFAVDLTDLAAVRQMAADVERLYGGVDILVLSAGGGRFLSIEETSAEEAADIMSSRYLSAFYVIRSLIGPMLGQNRGRIVVIGSSFAWLHSFNVAYKAAAHALHGLAQGLQTDLHDTAIHVMYVEPPPIRPLTTFFVHNPGTAQRLPAFYWRFTWTPDQLVRHILVGLERRSSYVSHPLMRILQPVYPLFSRPLVWLSRQQFPKFEDGGPLSGRRHRPSSSTTNDAGALTDDLPSTPRPV
ncbi:MAG: SDR family NAD(P)-dependent oxidoreductase [Sulfobacillus sp.]